MIYVFAACAVMLFIAAMLMLVRILRGPTALDRMVGVDMMTSILVGGFTLLAAFTRRSDLLAVIVVVSIVGFVGSTALARFARPIDSAERRVLSRAEEADMDQAATERARRNAAPVHDIDALADETQEGEQ